MARPSISTATGDSGETGLYGGSRVAKSHVRLHAYGDIDELNSLLGVCLSASALPTLLQDHLSSLQHTLFVVGADLATPLGESAKVHRLAETEVGSLEQWGAIVEEQLKPLTQFILPGGSPLAAQLHHARTVCRRAERWLVQLIREEPDTVNQAVLVYLNRLSDYLFLAARYANAQAEVAEPTWSASGPESS